MKKTFYITTTLPYVNAEPHIGFAYEILLADAIARYKKSLGEEVFFSTGTDEHGLKIYQKALERGENPQKYVDEYAKKFLFLKTELGIHEDLNFIRTTNPIHIKAAWKIWELCFSNGDIYKKKYKGLYCIGDESFIRESDLINGKCPNHPNLELQEVEEENYFFNLQKYKDRLKSYLEKDSIIPEWRKLESLKILQNMEDFSISREKNRLPWGIPVPNDEEQVMYVWFDALTNYISTLGWPDDMHGFYEKFWQGGYKLQLAGKDQVKFQSIIWQAMLMSAGLPNTDLIFYHGFINSGGQKMSKSLGNVISPSEMVKKYGKEATRYLLLRHIHPTEDTDVTWEKLDEWYEAGLVNGLGNLVSRILTMAENYSVTTIGPSIFDQNNKYLDNFNLQDYMNYVWSLIQKIDKKIQEEEPYKKYKTDKEIAINIVADLCTNLSEIANLLIPVMPETAEVVKNALRDLKKPSNLFPRIEAISHES